MRSIEKLRFFRIDSELADITDGHEGRPRWTSTIDKRP